MKERGFVVLLGGWGSLDFWMRLALRGWGSEHVWMTAFPKACTYDFTNFSKMFNGVYCTGNLFGREVKLEIKAIFPWWSLNMLRDGRVGTPS